MNIYDLNLFNKDAQLTFIYKKSQALAKALYMVTEYFPEQEPLKWNIRENANSLLQYSLSLALTPSSERKDIINSFLSSSLEILSLSEIASFSGLISQMNFQIIKREFESLITSINSQAEMFKLPSDFTLDEAMFNTDEIIPSHIQRQSLNQSKGRNILPKGQHLIKDTDNEPNKSDRKKLILDLLKERNDLGIKDISQVVKNCSEKTIQRELIQMVEQGLLKKSGERRWSKYSLV